MIDFDGPNLTITLESGGNSAIDIYSRWKEWVGTGNNAAFLAAFRVIGGDPLGAGQFAGSYFFLRNDYGWIVKPAEEDGASIVDGNLYPEDALLPLFGGTTGDFNTTLRLVTSSLTQVAEVNSGSGVTEQDKADIAALVWAELETDNQVTGTMGRAMSFVRKMLGNRAKTTITNEETGAGQSVIYDDNEVDTLLVFDHPDRDERIPQ